VPSKNDFAGIAQYPVNNRVYVADKKNRPNNQLSAGHNRFSKPVIAVSDSSLSRALDITIDTGIYALTPGGVNKFLGGKLTGLYLQNLTTPLPVPAKFTRKKISNTSIF